MTSSAIVVLNWNGIADTLPCPDSLLALNHESYHIIVVDNGSTDDSVEKLREYGNQHEDKVTVIYNQKNLGFTGGVNTGIKWALENDYEYIAIFNNDAVADPEWLTELTKVIQPKEIGMAQCLLLHRDGTTIDSTGDWYSKWGLPFPRNRDDLASLAPPSGFVFGASGGAPLYKAALFKDIGLFDEDFFAYYEDADIAFRAQLAGWKAYYQPTAIVYHEQGASSKRQISGFTTYQTFKNLPLLFLKDVPRGLLLFIGVRFYFAYLLIYLHAVTSGNGIPATKGLFKSLALSPAALSRRRVIQKNKRVPSEYITSILWNDLPPDQTGIRKVRKLLTGK